MAILEVLKSPTHLITHAKWLGRIGVITGVIMIIMVLINGASIPVVVACIIMSLFSLIASDNENDCHNRAVSCFTIGVAVSILILSIFDAVFGDWSNPFIGTLLFISGLCFGLFFDSDYGIKHLAWMASRGVIAVITIYLVIRMWLGNSVLYGYTSGIQCMLAMDIQVCITVIGILTIIYVLKNNIKVETF